MNVFGLPTKLQLNNSDGTNGNTAPYELGTLTITNSGLGVGDVTVWSGDYLDGNFTATNITAPQTIAEPAPEPGTLLLLGDGFGGLVVGVRARVARML